MTLDEARDAFEQTMKDNGNCTAAAVEYLYVALSYWRDDMILTGTLADVLRKTKRFIL